MSEKGGCTPLGGGSWACGGPLTPEALAEIELFREYLTLKSAGKASGPFEVWRKTQQAKE